MGWQIVGEDQSSPSQIREGGSARLIEPYPMGKGMGVIRIHVSQCLNRWMSHDEITQQFDRNKSGCLISDAGITTKNVVRRL